MGEHNAVVTCKLSEMSSVQLPGRFIATLTVSIATCVCEREREREYVSGEPVYVLHLLVPSIRNHKRAVDSKWTELGRIEGTPQ